MALFASGIVCIFIATLRAAQITANTIKTNTPTDGTWLTLWGMVECAIAIIIDCRPSFAVLINATRKSSKKPSSDANGYVKQSEDVRLRTVGSMTTRSRNKNPGLETTDSLWVDVHSSQEELAANHDGIIVSTNVKRDEYSSGSTKFA